MLLTGNARETPVWVADTNSGLVLSDKRLVGPPLLRAGATHRECPGDSGLGRGHEFGRLSFRVSIGIVLESQASRQVKPVKTSCWVWFPIPTASLRAQARNVSLAFD